MKKTIDTALFVCSVICNELNNLKPSDRLSRLDTLSSNSAAHATCIAYITLFRMFNQKSCERFSKRLSTNSIIRIQLDKKSWEELNDDEKISTMVIWLKHHKEVIAGSFDLEKGMPLPLLGSLTMVEA